MIKNVALLLLVMGALATAGSVAKGTLTATVVPGTDPVVMISGTGFQNSGRNELTVIVWGSSNPVDCAAPSKNGDFECTTTVDAPGYYDVVAYENSKTIIASTAVLVQ